jgi:type IV pilus assembly protein PilX
MNTLPNKIEQSGVVLVISLIMLVLLTLISITSMQVTGLEEKMAGNSKDKNVAFQAAGAALRDAERDISYSNRISGVTGMTDTCAAGLCYFGPAGMSNIWDDASKVANAVPYGTYTAATTISGVINQPRYLVIGTKFWPAGATSWKYMYKSIAIAQGGRATTQSVLKSVYAP